MVILAICFAFVREQRGGEAAAPSNPGLAKAGKPPVIPQLTDFTLTNQLDQPVRLARFADKVWFADIVFTRCAGPWPGAAGKHNVREPDLVRKSGQAHRLVELVRQGKVG